MTPDETTIVVDGRQRRVVLVAEAEVARGKLQGALRREHLDADGGLHVRYDQEDLPEAALLELRARQLTPEARALAEGLTPAERTRVLRTPSGTVQRVRGVGWARAGSAYHVSTGPTLVPRALLLDPAKPAPVPAPRTPEQDAEDAVCRLDASEEPFKGERWEAAVSWALSQHRRNSTVKWRNVHALPGWAWLECGRVVHAVARADEALAYTGAAERVACRVAFTRGRWTLVLGRSPACTDAALTTIALSLVLEGPPLAALLPAAEALRATGRYEERRAKVAAGFGTDRVGGKTWAEVAQGGPR